MQNVKRIHIIGPPRSGTTLMLELMITCFRFTHYVRQEVSLLRYPDGLPDGATLCTKCPRDHHLVREILPCDGSQWFVSLTRDPRDVVVSRHGLRPEIYWTNLRLWKSWFNNVRDFRNHDRFIDVRYEELVECPDRVQQEIARRLPFLPVCKKFSEYERASNPSRESLAAMRGLRPIGNASVGRWKGHLPRIAGQLEIHGSIDAELIQLGYEDHPGWKTLLEGVRPDLRPGHFPEAPSRNHLRRLQLDREEYLPAYLARRGLRRA